MSVLSGSEALVRALEAHGVEVVFGIAGTHNLPIYDAMRESRQLRPIVSRHEQGAGFMADGYARATGRPGVLLTVTGPGVTNALTPLGQAYSDSVPVLHLATQVQQGQADRGLESFHELRDSLAVTGAVTTWNARARSAAEIPDLIAEAFRRFRSERPRPIFLEIPLDVLTATAEIAAPRRIAVQPRAPDPAALAEAVDRLLNARRPLLYAGGGVIASDASGPLVRIAERLQAPVIASANGKGAFPEDHPLFLGGGWGAHAIGHEAFAEADVVLAVGARFGPLPTFYWSLEIPGQLIHVDLDPTEIGKHYPAHVGIVADACQALTALDATLAGRDQTPPDACWCDVKRLRDRGWRRVAERAGAYLDCFRGLRAVLPPDALLFNDLTSLGYWSHPGFSVTIPRTYHYPVGFGCLGHAFPAAIGAKVAFPGCPVVALAGDGGFLFTGQELATAVYYEIPVVAVVFNDNAYGAVKLDQEIHFAGRTFANDLRSPDFVQLARAYGAQGRRVAGLAEVPGAVAEALAHRDLTIIECPVQQVAPPWIQ